MDFAALNRLDLNAPAFVPSEERAATGAGARGSEQRGGSGAAAAARKDGRPRAPQRKAKAKAEEVCRNSQAGRRNRGDKARGGTAAGKATWEDALVVARGEGRRRIPFLFRA